MGNLKLSDNKMIAGVCAGYAEFFGIDTSIVRIIFVILAIFGSVGLWIYLFTWLYFTIRK